MSLSRLTCATLIITDACAFISVHVPGVGGSCEISTTTRPQVTGCGRDDASMFITSGSKRNWPLDTESKGRLVRQRVRGWNRCPCVFPLRAKRTKRLEEDDEQGRELVELRQRKLDEWQALIKSGKVRRRENKRAVVPSARLNHQPSHRHPQILFAICADDE